MWSRRSQAFMWAKLLVPFMKGGNNIGKPGGAEEKTVTSSNIWSSTMGEKRIPTSFSRWYSTTGLP